MEYINGVLYQNLIFLREPQKRHGIYTSSVRKYMFLAVKRLTKETFSVGLTAQFTYL